MTRDKWTFERYLDEIIHLSEIAEIPGIQAARETLIKEMWARYPQDCKDCGLRDGVKA